MTSSYIEFPCKENSVDWSTLSRSCTSFYRWLYRWHKQTGDVSPSTRYFARKQGKTTRTVYRWLADLEAAGAIIREVEQGVERSIVPLVPPPVPPKCHRLMSPVHGAKCHRSIPYDASTHGTQQQTVQCVESSVGGSGESEGFPQSQSVETETVKQAAPIPEHPAQSIGENPPSRIPAEKLAGDLAAVGVAVPIARHLAAAAPEQTAQQLAALPYRQARDRAAVLVASIKQSWPIPEAFKQALARKQKEAQEAQNRAMRAALEAKRASQRVKASTALQSLSAEARAAVLSEACEALRKEQPAAYRLMYGKVGFDSWINGRAVQLVAARGVG